MSAPPDPGPAQPPEPPNHPLRAKDVGPLICKRVG